MNTNDLIKLANAGTLNYREIDDDKMNEFVCITIGTVYNGYWGFC